MALPVPNLDDRTFQDIVNEARRRIPLYCPEWTDHNLSDPGITLIELFAWMTELLIYRLNRVPDKNYVKFLELIGVKLTPGGPARADLTFRLTAPTQQAITIPKGDTEVATVRTETKEAIVFTTDEDLAIAPPQLDYLLLSKGDADLEDVLPRLREMEGQVEGVGTESSGLQPVALFQSVPYPGDAIYLGFGSEVRRAVLSLSLQCEEQPASGIKPSNPPREWEYWDGQASDWVQFRRDRDSEAWIETDETRGFIQPGRVLLHVPAVAEETTVAMRRANWIRCRLTPWTREQGFYESSPRLRAVACAAVGGTVRASNVTRVVGELLGTSNGRPGQVMQVSKRPMLSLEAGERVEVEGENESGWQPWVEVEDFSDSGESDRHFVCDPVAGEISFGPAIRSPSGHLTQYGAVPPRGVRVRLSAYRYGGGPKGNVGQGTLSVLKSSIPYVASVTNRRLATGGVDPEPIENAKLRGPHALRTWNRAVTAEDFEYLAREAAPAIGRVGCFQPGDVESSRGPLPGVVQVLLVPALSPSGGPVDAEQLQIPRSLRQRVTAHLDERRLLTTSVLVSEPDYTWISVETRVKARRGYELKELGVAVEARLYQFVHPLFGGSDGSGWVFGRQLFPSELYGQIQQVDGVEYVEDLAVFQVDPSTAERVSIGQSLTIPPTGLLCSTTHRVQCF